MIEKGNMGMEAREEKEIQQGVMSPEMKTVSRNGKSKAKNPTLEPLEGHFLADTLISAQ